jgi:hypothetical protein
MASVCRLSDQTDAISRKLDGAERSCRQKKESGDECEGAFDDNTQQAEGQQAYPDERIKDEGYERERPADDEEEAEEEELDHDVSSFPRHGLGDGCIEVYAGKRKKVPDGRRCGKS